MKVTLPQNMQVKENRVNKSMHGIQLLMARFYCRLRKARARGVPSPNRRAAKPRKAFELEFGGWRLKIERVTTPGEAPNAPVDTTAPPIEFPSPPSEASSASTDDRNSWAYILNPDRPPSPPHKPTRAIPW
jgi:hypothetical protein